MPGPADAPASPSTVLGARPAGWLLLVCLLLLVMLAAGVASGNSALLSVDHAVADWGYSLTYGHAGLSAWWIAVARDAQPWVVRLVLLVVAVGLAWRRRWRLASWLAGLSVVENVVAPLSKLVLSRPRPTWRHPITVERTLSFPSGHATAAGMFVVAVSLLTLTVAGSVTVRSLLIGAAVLVWLVVSMDRIFLGVHYLSDVLAGNLLGAALVLAGWLVLVPAGSRAQTSTVPPERQ